MASVPRTALWTIFVLLTPNGNSIMTIGVKRHLVEWHPIVSVEWHTLRTDSGVAIQVASGAYAPLSAKYIIFLVCDFSECMYI